MYRLILLEKILNENQLQDFCQEIINSICKYRIILLYGEMGAGKTRWVRSLGELLGFSQEVGSPTFSIINEYHVPENSFNIHRIYHMDFYRLKNQQQALDIGFLESLDRADLCIIEWPQIIESIIQQDDRLEIRIEVLDNQQRRFTLTV